MTRNILLMTAATALSTILLTGAAMAQVSPFATTTLTAASSAAVFNATITIDGSKTTLPNQVVASGKALPLYNETTNKASYTKMETFDLLTMNATAGKLVSTARAVSTASGGLTSSASASIGSLKVVFSSPLGTAAQHQRVQDRCDGQLRRHEKRQAGNQAHHHDRRSGYRRNRSGHRHTALLRYTGSQ